MPRAKYLDRSEEEAISSLIVESTEDLGYTSDQLVAGLLAALVTVVEELEQPTYVKQGFLDEAIDVLMDAGVSL
jgi:hypothetical protein